jgi:hypothetical protein
MALSLFVRQRAGQIGVRIDDSNMSGYEIRTTRRPSQWDGLLGLSFDPWLELSLVSL